MHAYHSPFNPKQSFSTLQNESILLLRLDDYTKCDDLRMISTFLELKNPLKNATNIFLKLLTKSFVFKKVSKVVVKKQGQVAKLNISKVEKCTLSFKFATFLRVFDNAYFLGCFSGRAPFL